MEANLSEGIKKNMEKSTKNNTKPSKKAIQKITMAEMIKLEPTKKIELSNDFLDALKFETSNYAVIILTPNTKIIRIIPINANKVYKIGIDISTLTPDFLREIGNLFIKLGLKALYSTGLCFLQEKCVFEGYIDSTETDKIKLKNLKEKLLAIKGITGVNVSILEVK